LIEISPYTKSSIRITGKRLNFSGSLSKSVQPSFLANMIIHMILEEKAHLMEHPIHHLIMIIIIIFIEEQTKAKQEQEEGEEEKESAEKSEGKVNPNLDILTLLVDKRVQRRS